jgi:hypothetical protein
MLRKKNRLETQLSSSHNVFEPIVSSIVTSSN